MTLEERVQILEQQVTDMRAARSGSKLRTPVTILDDSDRPVCRLNSKDKHVTIEFLNAKGNKALVLGVDGTDSGFVTINNPDGLPVAFIDAEDFGGRLELKNQQGSTGVAIQGNDCDGVSGWLKILSHEDDDEIYLSTDSN
jgi:hypothetical protein